MSEGDSRLARRLMSRASGGLYRRTTPDGGEVFTGPAARQALRSLGARAFTMDHTIIVDEGFDVSNPEDAALYAHELHHQMESGGVDSHSERDGEEIAARAIERMVYHRMASGDDFGAVMRDAKSGAVMRDARSGASSDNAYIRTPSKDDDKPSYGDAIRAVEAVLGEGLSYDILVRDLARYCIEQMNKQREFTTARRSKNEAF